MTTHNEATTLLASLTDDELSNLSSDELDELLSLVEQEETEAIYDWDSQCLPYQRMPTRDLASCDWISKDFGAGKVGNDAWSTVLWLCGRGSGKSRTIIENVNKLVEAGEYSKIGIVATTERILRESYALGLVKASPPWNRARYIANQAKIVWPNGAQANLLSSENVEALRSWNLDLLVCDELCFWSKPEAYATIRAALRVGKKPLCLIGTSPKSTELLWQIVKSDNTVVIQASTYDNTYLTKEAIEALTEPWIGTADYDSEILGKLYEKIVGALWTQEVISDNRILESDLPELARIVVGVDPGAYSEGGDGSGIIVAATGVNNEYYILKDYSIDKGSPNDVAKAIALAYEDSLAGFCIIEVNNGGSWLTTVINAVDPTINIQKVSASVGKLTRAEPISALYAQNKVHHVGNFDLLEKELRTWVPGRGKSPNRLDALVWALTSLSGKSREVKFY